jgi:serine/threonine protein phosphatase PrpC
VLFETATISRIGGRANNEDACASLMLQNTGCWVVADGLGGHEGGEVASRAAVDAILESFRRNPELSSRALASHLDAAQAAIVAQEKRQGALSGMRSTVVVLVSDGSSVLWAHVGDSRLYYFQNGRVAFQTKDHSLVETMVSAGEVATADFRQHEDRNRLLRALGGHEELRPAISTEKQKLYRGDVLLLCSDGFWGNVTEPEMEADLAKAKTPQEWISHMETRLLERVSGEYDNYTAVAVSFTSSSAPPPPDPSKRGRLNGFRLSSALILLLVLAIAGWLYRQRWILLDWDLSGLSSPAKLKPGKVFVPAQRKRYPTIAEAIEGAGKGQTIWIGPGTYTERLTIANPVCLKGAGDHPGDDRTTLDMSKLGPLTVNGAEGMLDSLSIKGPEHDPALVFAGSFQGKVISSAISGAGDCLVSIGEQSEPVFEKTRFEGTGQKTKCFCGRPTSVGSSADSPTNQFVNCVH